MLRSTFFTNKTQHLFDGQFVRLVLLVGAVLLIPISSSAEDVGVLTTRTDRSPISALLVADTEAGSVFCNVDDFDVAGSSLNTSNSVLGVSAFSAKLGGLGRAIGNSATTTIPAPRTTAAQASIDITSGHIVASAGFEGSPNTFGVGIVSSIQEHTTTNRVAGLVNGGKNDGIHTLHAHLHLIQFGSNTDHIRRRTDDPINPGDFFRGNFVRAQVGDSFASAEYLGDGFFFVDVRLETVDEEEKGGEGPPLIYDELVFGGVNDHFFAEQLVVTGESIAIACRENTDTAASNSGLVTCDCGKTDAGRSRDIWQYKAFGSLYVTDETP